MKRLYLFIAFLMLNFAHAQLDNIHYLQPIIFSAYQADTIVEEYIYLSTPSTSNITVTITRPDGTPAPRMSVTNIGVGTTYVTNGIVTFNNSTPLRLRFVNASNTAIASGGNQNPITRPTNTAGTIIPSNAAGLIFQSTDNFFVNYRGQSDAQAGSVLTKGRVALGKNFFWGGTPTQFTAPSATSVGNMVSMMATEDNTIITISNIKPGTQFINGTSSTPITGPTITRTLNKGQSFVLYARARDSQLSIQDTGWLGAKITSTKDIAVTVGGLMQQGGASGSRDFAVDQLVPVEQLGNEYVVMQGYGGNYERVVAIATEPNTTISINGNTGTNITLTNAGDYQFVPIANFVNQNMYIKTNKPIYLFHKIFGSAESNTNSFMFIPPLSCFGQTEVNMIPDARRIGGTDYTGTQLAVLAASGTANIPSVTVNNIALAAASTAAVPGNPNWTSYRFNISGGSGGGPIASVPIKNVRISSAGTIQAELIGASDAAGFGGYYSGFGTAPVVNVEITNSPNPLRPCTGGSGSSSMSVTSGLGTYQWYKDNVAIPGAVNNSYTIPSTDTTPAEYNVIVTIPGGCLVYSDVVSSFICPCYKPGVAGTPEITKIGISTRETASTPNFPADRNNGFLVLESNDKGLVISRMADPETSILEPVDGMIVFDTDENCLKIYDGTNWSCINQTCN